MNPTRIEYPGHSPSQLSCSIRHLLAIVLLFATVFGVSVATAATPKFSCTEDSHGVNVLIDDELFTRYHILSGTRPVLWPLVGPTGKRMTRAYPVGKGSDQEEKDHLHHRSMWFGYEGLNGNDYWHEPEKDETRPFPIGTVKHREFSEVKSDSNGVTIVAKNDWMSKTGELVCSDTRTFRFGCTSELRWIDCHVELKASAGPLRIGDSKEGLFAVRVAPTMRVDAELGGEIITSTGKTDVDAWAQRAEWVDYHGPVDGETVGIAILCHPNSFDPKPRWHVRTYGLFASNPFGKEAFTDPDSDVTKRPLRLTVPGNDSLQFRYRMILHRGDEKQAQIAKEYDKYAAE